eukprot:10750845-Alexandrium_andersonii.AAC.1
MLSPPLSGPDMCPPNTRPQPFHGQHRGQLPRKTEQTDQRSKGPDERAEAPTGRARIHAF